MTSAHEWHDGKERPAPLDAKVIALVSKGRNRRSAVYEVDTFWHAPQEKWWHEIGGDLKVVKWRYDVAPAVPVDRPRYEVGDPSANK